MDEWKNAGRSGPIQIPWIHTSQRWNINQAHSAITRLIILLKNNCHQFLGKTPFSVLPLCDDRRRRRRRRCR